MNMEAVEETSSPSPTSSPRNSASGFSLFGPSSPIAHETQFSSRRGATPKGTEFSTRSSSKEEDPMNDPRVKAAISDLETELSRKTNELMEVSRKLAQAESKAQQIAAELEKLRSENTSLRLSPSKSPESNIEAGVLRRDLDRVKSALEDARSENIALNSSLRGRERAYDELQEVICVCMGLGLGPGPGLELDVGRLCVPQCGCAIVYFCVYFCAHARPCALACPSHLRLLCVRTS